MGKKGLRFGGGSLEMKGGTGGITQMCFCGDFLEVYKVDATFRVQSPESLDPEETNPNMPWVVTHISDVGSGNKIVARVLLQSKEILNKAMLPSDIDKESLICILHECKELLLGCEEVASGIKAEVKEIIDKIHKKEITVDKPSRALNPFPQVQRLEDRCSMFLVNSKRYSHQLSELINEFFKTDFRGPHFHKIKNWSKEYFGSNSAIHQLIKDNEPKLKYLIDLRNLQEHPTKNKKTIIENFCLLPNLKIQPPTWSVEGAQPGPISEEMQYIVKFLLEFTEILLIHCTFQLTETKIPYYVVHLPEKDRKKECPIKYELQVDLKRLKPSKA